ncbi:hypothetical protein GYB59_02115 [bacterium]|nr:hypothetical protein [bacterium]
MAAGDTISGLGGDVKKAAGDSLLNVKKWSLTKTRNVKKYAVAGSAWKRASGGTIEASGTVEIELEEDERSEELNIDEGDTLEVDFVIDANSKYTGKIVVNSVAEGVNMDDGQVDTVVVQFDVDGELTRTGILAGKPAA